MIQSDRDSKESTISIPRRPGCVAEGGALDILDIPVDFPFVLDDFLSFCFLCLASLEIGFRLPGLAANLKSFLNCVMFVWELGFCSVRFIAVCFIYI